MTTNPNAEIHPDRIGDWNVERLLASGAHGTVYEASQCFEGQLERWAAVKLLDERAGRVEIKRMIEIGKQLEGSVPTIHDGGPIDDGRFCIAMQLFDRGSLRRRFKDVCPADVSEALRLAQRLKDTVGGLHRIGYVHGDLKPGNLLIRNRAVDSADSIYQLVRDDEDLVLIDFATARRIGEPNDLLVAVETPGYSAPELNNGRTEIDVTADIYSASVMLVELLSGASPRPVKSRRDTAFDDDHLAATGPLRPVLSKGLSYEPFDRPKTMRAWSKELDSAFAAARGPLGNQVDLDTGPPPRLERLHNRPLRLVTLAVVVLLAASLGAAGLSRLPSEQTADPRAAGPDTSLEPAETVEENTDQDPQPDPDPIDSGLDPATNVGPATSLSEPAPTSLPAKAAIAEGDAEASPEETTPSAQPPSPETAPDELSSPVASAVLSPTTTGLRSPATNSSLRSTTPDPTSPGTTVATTRPSTTTTTTTTTPVTASTTPPTQPQPNSLAASATNSGSAAITSARNTISGLCAATNESDHGDTVRIDGIDHEIVIIAVDPSSRPLDGGGFQIGHTGAGPFLIVGSPLNDNIIGHGANDVICGMAGDDFINGKDGDDFLLGGPGADKIQASSGINVLLGDASDTDLIGGSDNDWCSDVSGTRSPCEHRIQVMDATS